MVKPTDKTRVLKLKRQKQALDLRLAGHKYADIAAKIGISVSRAQALVVLAMGDAREQISASGDELRAAELARLDAMLVKVFPRASKGELAAVDRVLKIAERRARMLGLDAPVRTALQGGGDDAPPIVSEAKVTFYMPDNGRG